MQRLKILLVVFLIITLTVTPIGYLILNKARVKKDNVINQELAYQKSLQSNMETYKKERESEIAAQKQSNLQTMAIAKTNYESLLAQQDALIKQNSTVVKTQVTTQTVTTKKSTTKPKSTSTTKSS